MKFHAAILQANGRVTANQPRDGKEITRDRVTGRLVDEFRQLLRESLGDDPEKTGKFMAPFGTDRRLVLEWQQVEPTSALCKFLIHGELAAVSLYLYGATPEIDAVAIDATEALFEKWFHGSGLDPMPGLRSIQQRPALIAMPRPQALMHDDWRIIGNLCPCQAVPFFERAAAFVKKVEAYWRKRGFRPGGTPTEHLRN